MLTISKKLIWLTALLLATAASGMLTAFALNPQRAITQYGHDLWLPRNGLPANAVNVALQTHDGYLWLGTTAGLFHFDGVRFEGVSTDSRHKNDMETVSALCESKDGSLWIGTAYNGLRRLKGGKALLYGPDEGFPERQIKTLFESRAGELWIATTNGLFKFADEKFIAIPISPQYVTSLSEDSSGRIWAGTHVGIHIFEADREVATLNLSNTNKLYNNVINVIHAGYQGEMWIGSYSSLSRWKEGVVTTYSVADGLSDAYVTTIEEDGNGNLWVGTNKGGLNRLSEGRWTHYGVTEGLSNNHVTSIIKDREGSLWVSTLEGLNRFKDVNVIPFTSKEGLASDYVSSVVETPDRSLYFFSDGDASVTRLKDGRLTQFQALVGPVYAARDGSLWMGHTGLLVNIKDGKLIHRFDTRAGLPAKWISAITEDDEGLIIYVDHTGIRRFVDGKLKPYLLKNGQAYDSVEYVACFYSEPGGALWIGTARGLVRIQNGESTIFGTADGLADDWAGAFLDDHQGSLWIASPRGGLTRYRNGHFTAYTTKNGLFTDEIYSVLDDDQGYFWLSSPRGIGRISRQDLDDYEAGRIPAVHTQVFTTADGMKTDQCFGEWQPSGWKTRDGRVWFATKKGAVMIDPKALSRNGAPPPVRVEQVVVDQQIAMPDQSLSFSPGKEKWEFHYTALSYLVPERVLFKYKLEGYDKDWVEAGTQRVAYYMNLPPGHYRFRVMACNNDGVWNETGDSVDFYLAPHFYQTWWCYGLCVIALGGIGFGVYWLRLRHLIAQEKRLLRHVAERTRELYEKTEELEKEMTERKHLEEQLLQAQKMEAIGRLSGGVAHDFNNLLTVIIGYSDILMGELPEDDLRREQIEEIEKAGKRAAALTSQLLAFSRKQIMQPKILNLNAVIADISKMLQRVIGEDVELKTDLDMMIGLVKADPGQIEQIIMNLAVNARDAMPAGGKLTIETQNVDLDESYASQHAELQPGAYVMFAISDTGCGMDRETQAHIFEPFFTTKEVGKGTGLGLATVYGIVKQSGGHIWVYSEAGKGTAFKIYLPRIEVPSGEQEARESASDIRSGAETILLVEDEAGVRNFARQVLQKKGYTVLEAAHADGALQLAKECKEEPHLMVTDIIMPGPSGKQLAERIAPLFPHMQVLYMSGYTDDAIVHHGMLNPGTAYLEKPFSADALARKVREVLDSSRKDS